jgi:hypothetical protein
LRQRHAGAVAADPSNSARDGRLVGYVERRIPVHDGLSVDLELDSRRGDILDQAERCFSVLLNQSRPQDERVSCFLAALFGAWVVLVFD